MDLERKSKLVSAGINIDGALERFMGNEKMLEKYLGRFLSEKSYGALRDAVNAGDQAGAAAAAHMLKSVCGTIGCETMQGMVVAQEAAMKAGKWADAVGMMPEIEKIYSQICAALES